jgi:hypothetical protein
MGENSAIDRVLAIVGFLVSLPDRLALRATLGYSRLDI